MVASHGTPSKWPCAAGSCWPRPPVDPTAPSLESSEIDRKTVMSWRGRFAQEGVESLVGCGAGPGTQAHLGPEDRGHSRCDPFRPSQRDDAMELPLDGEKPDVRESTVSRVWRSHNLKPHRVESFKFSRGRSFLEKLTDMVGLYLNPPQQALVSCGWRKSQVQAFDRTPPACRSEEGVAAL